MRTQRKFTGIMPRNATTRSVDNFFNEKVKMVLGAKTITSPGIKLPKVASTEDDVSIELSIPGYKTEDISIYTENQKLNVAVRDYDTVSNRQHEWSNETFVYNAFDLHYSIPENSDIENISAEYDEDSGLLKIDIPVSNEKSNPMSREIPVTS